jgi:hypothetical protein
LYNYFRAVRRERLLDTVDELLFSHVLGRARGTRVSVVDLLQDLGCQDEKHELQGPDGTAMLVLCLLIAVQQVKEGVATACQLVTLNALKLSKFLK